MRTKPGGAADRLGKSYGPNLDEITADAAARSGRIDYLGLCGPAETEAQKPGEIYPGCGFTEAELLEDVRRNFKEYRLKKAYWAHINNVFGFGGDVETLAFTGSRAMALVFARNNERVSVRELFVLQRGRFFLGLDSTILSRLGRKLKESVQEREFAQVFQNSGIRQGHKKGGVGHGAKSGK